MKILIPYDGSKTGDAALRGLQKAGLGQDHMLLVTVTDLFLPETHEEFLLAAAGRRRTLSASGFCSYVPARRIWEESFALMRELENRVPQMFPSWKVQIDALPANNLVSSEILGKTRSWRADLLVVGARGIFSAERSGYGPAALRLVREADCSVFIAREKDFAVRIGADESLPARLIIILDDSRNDAEIVRAVARRQWAQESEARIVEVGKKQRLDGASPVLKKLQDKGLKVSILQAEINDPSALADAVLDWNPSFIFAGGDLGDKNGNFSTREFRPVVDQLLLRAKCSFELVRQAREKPIVSGLDASGPELSGRMLKTDFPSRASSFITYGNISDNEKPARRKFFRFSLLPDIEKGGREGHFRIEK